MEDRERLLDKLAKTCIDFEYPEERLRKEITDLKETLVRIDKDSASPTHNFAENITRISKVWQTLADDKLYDIWYDVIPDLLSIGPLVRTEIPLDVLDQLFSLGFDTGVYSQSRCLDIAVEKCHYNVIRLLCKRGVIAKYVNASVTPPPIAVLASQPDAPLDLFDLLATPENLNTCKGYGKSGDLPLHKAVSCGNTDAALHLIKLGASVNQEDGSSKLPFEHFRESQSNSELLMSILPQKGHGVRILQTIMRTYYLTESPNESNPGLFEIFHQLMQRLHFDADECLDLMVESGGDDDDDSYAFGFLAVNNYQMANLWDHGELYFYSMILVRLQLRLASEYLTWMRWPYIAFRPAIAKILLSRVPTNIWRNYLQQSRVKSLLQLCISCTRDNMHSLDDESFLSLPVPPYILKQLTYRDVSEEIFKEWCQGLPTSS